MQGQSTAHQLLELSEITFSPFSKISYSTMIQSTASEITKKRQIAIIGRMTDEVSVPFSYVSVVRINIYTAKWVLDMKHCIILRSISHSKISGHSKLAFTVKMLSNISFCRQLSKVNYNKSNVPPFVYSINSCLNLSLLLFYFLYFCF